MTNRVSNAIANDPGTTQTPDGCVVKSQPGVLVTCQHGGDRPDHVDARTGSAGHQRRA